MNLVLSRAIVVAKYKEDISWLSKLPPEIKVYVYDSSPGGNLQDLKRERHEPYTYFTHMIDHYDELDDLTVFCQGSPFDSVSEQEFMRVTLNCTQPYMSIGKFRTPSALADEDVSLGYLPISKTLTKFFGIPHKTTVSWTHGAEFLVAKERILQYSKQTLIRARQHTLDVEPLWGERHIFERMWDTIFGYEWHKHKWGIENNGTEK